MDRDDMTLEEFLIEILHAGEDTQIEDEDIDTTVFGDGRFIRTYKKDDVWYACLGSREASESEAVEIAANGETLLDALANLIDIVRRIYLTVI